MSYLPRMSKTYKEPPQQPPEEPEQILSSLSLQPASSLLNEKTHNPQMALKQYRFIPHPPPVLPGPSVAAEVRENEMYREASRLRRSSSKFNESPDAAGTERENSKEGSSLVTIVEDNTGEKSSGSPKRSRSRKSMRASKTSVSKKRSSKHSIKKKESSSKVTDLSVNLCLVGTDIGKSFVDAQAEVGSEQCKKEISQDEAKTVEEADLPASTSGVSAREPTTTWSSFKKILSEDPNTGVRTKEVNHRSVQCTIFGSAEKTFVVPPVVKCLLQTLAFLLHELNREDGVSSSYGDKKTLLNQIQLILGDLCNEKINKEFGFDVTYSDSKRVEKILGDLQCYVKSIYGEKGETFDKTEDVKKVFIQLRQKEMELTTLKQKIAEEESFEVAEDFFKESDFKNPEITLQNKRLESEQLLAKVQFSGVELKKIQKSLAEVEWEVRCLQEQMSGLRKSLSSKSRTEIPGRKAGVQKISAESLARLSKSKESGISNKKT